MTALLNDLVGLLEIIAENPGRAIEETVLANYGDLTLVTRLAVKFARCVTALLNDLVGLLEIIADNGITGPLNSMCQCPLSE